MEINIALHIPAAICQLFKIVNMNYKLWSIYQQEKI